MDKNSQRAETASSLPVFLFGSKNLRLDSLPLTLQRLSGKEFSEIFDIENEEKNLEVRRILDYSAHSQNLSDKQDPATVLFVRSESKPAVE